MSEKDLYHLRYPIGKFIIPETIVPSHIHAWIEDIAILPDQLKKSVENLTENQLTTPYRQDGWIVRQVVNHVADSHMNAYIRIKLALTEAKPTIKPYEEQFWAELEDGKNTPIHISLTLLDALHQRWVILLKSLTESDLQKSFIHPSNGNEIKIEEAIGTYSWHGRHHLAHITELVKRENWK